MLFIKRLWGAEILSLNSFSHLHFISDSKRSITHISSSVFVVMVWRQHRWCQWGELWTFSA